MRKIWNTLCVFVLAFCLFAMPAYAESEVYTADDVLHYDGLATRVKDDVPGIRSMYTVNKKAVAYFEAEGYTVAYGAVMAIGEMNGATVEDGDTPRTARTLTVAKTATGYKANGAYAAAVTVYETGNPDYATGLCLTNNASGATFAYTTTYTKAENRTVAYLEGTQLCYAGFVALTKDGKTTYTYVYAEGEEFGASESVYGAHTSVYEASEYFLNDYRVSVADEKSPFAENATLRRTVATCGIVIDHADMEKHGSATEIAADTTAGTDATYVVNGFNADNGISFTVPNAKAGMYSVLVRLTNNSLRTSQVDFEVNGRRYSGRILDGETLASENLAVASDDGYRDCMFHVMLDEGDNEFKLYMVQAWSYDNPFGVAGVKLVMDAEISQKDVVLGSENLVSGPAGYTKNEKGTGLFKDIYYVAYGSNGEFVYNVKIPANGTYRMVALSTFSQNATVTTTFVDGDGVVVASDSFTSTVKMKHGSARSIQVVDAFGSFTLPQGDLTLKIHSPGQVALSNIALIYEEPVEEEDGEKTTVFDFLAKEQDLHSSAVILENGTVFLPKSNYYNGSQRYPLKMTVKIEQAGVYRLSGKYNVNGGKIPYLTMTSDIDTAHGMESRLNSAGTNKEYASNEEFSVTDHSTSFTDADALGFIYLSAGTHTLTLLYQGYDGDGGIGGLGIYNLRLSLETAQPDGSIRISSQDYDTATAVNVNKSSGAYASKALLIQGTTGHAEYTFTPSVSGIYSLYALMADRTGKTDVFTVTDADGNEVHKVSFTTAGSLWCASHYGFGNAGAAVIETHLADGIYLEAGKTYTLSADATTSDSRLMIADLRLVLTKREVTYYEKVDVDFTAGAVDATTGEVVEKADSFVTEPLLIPKAGTTLRLVTNASLAGALTENNFAVVAYKVSINGYIPDLDNALNFKGCGYAVSDATCIGGGYVSYYITTTSDDTVLRFSCMAKEAAQIGLYYVADDKTEITVADFEDVDLSTALTVTGATLGTDATVSVNVRGVMNGTLLLMAYDKAETLVSVKTLAKTEFDQSFSVAFEDATAAVASVRLLLVDGILSANALTDMTVIFADKTVTVPAADVVIDPATLVPGAANENAFVVRADEMTASANVPTLSDGTLLLGNGTSYYATFKVNAPVAGVYKLDVKYNRANNYIQYFYVHNQSSSAWGSGVRGEGRIGKSTDVSTATGDEGFAVGNALRYSAYDATPEAYVWLDAGENELKISMYSSAATAKLGVDSIRFTAEYAATADTVKISYDAMKTPPSGYKNVLSSENNGFFLRDGSTVYFNVTVPEDGAYKVTSLASTDNATATFSSPEMTFFPVSTVFGSNKVGNTSTSVLPLENGILHLSQGTHTVALSVTGGSGGFYHFNMLTFDKVGKYDETKKLSVTENSVDIDRENGAFTASYTASVVKGVYEGDLTAYLEVSGVDANGSFNYVIEKTVPVGAVTELLFEGEARTGLKEIEVVFSLYDKNGENNELLYSADPVRYTVSSGLNVLIMTDTHYTGLNENQKVYNYSRDEWVLHEKNALKHLNFYTREYDIYGWTSDEKLQMVVDKILLAYEKGEIDMVFLLGDSAMNDGNYGSFHQDNVRYKEALNKKRNIYSDPDGEQLEGFWEHPLNISYVVKKRFFDKLSEAGIPYYVANGNHDYMYGYNDDKSDIDFTPWENLYHYAELFGHRTDEANGKYLRDDDGNYICYEDSDAANYVVRVIRRNGEVKIVSALSEADLIAFKAKYAGDGNCYDFYVSEDTLSSSDELLAAFVMSNGFQIDTYDFYTETGVYTDPETGVVNYSGQTIRYSHLRDGMMRAMSRIASEYPNAYMVSHMVEPEDLYEYMSAYDNFRGCFYGDVHDEERYSYGEEEYPFWVAGCFSAVYDVDYYYNADGTPDKQYYYDRSFSENKVGNVTWGDFTRHPWNYIALEVHGDFSYATRVHSAAFYENGAQVTLTFDEVTGMDIRYKRATVDPTLYQSGEILYAAHIDGVTKLYREAELAAAGLSADDSRVRKVFVGGDAAIVGADYMYMKANYAENTYVNPDYIIDKAGNVYTTSMVKIGTATNENGSAFSHPSAFAPLTDEGKKVVFNGEIYYLSGAIGGVKGHYLYDMNSNYVYVDNAGNLVFYNSIAVDEDYVEASIQEQFVLNDKSSFTLYDPPHKRTWFYRAEDGSFVSLDKDGDGKLDAGTYTGFYRTKSQEKHYEGADIPNPTIVIDENGKFVTGEGWAHFQYLATYTYADGDEVESGEDGDIAIDRDANGNIVYGMYIPYAEYAGEWF